MYNTAASRHTEYIQVVQHVTAPASHCQEVGVALRCNHRNTVSSKSHILMNVLLQLRRQLASEAERQTEDELTKHSESDTNSTWGFPQQGSSVEPLHLVSTLRAYRDLGFHPSQGLLTAAEPFLSCLQQPLPLHSALDLTSLFRAFTWQPG